MAVVDAKLRVHGLGRLRVVDLKTGRRTPKEADVAAHPQLGVYQLAASLGGFDDVAEGERAVAAPALAYLRDGDVLPALVSRWVARQSISSTLPSTPSITTQSST